jgi:hypothetical protein
MEVSVRPKTTDKTANTKTHEPRVRMPGKPKGQPIIMMLPSSCQTSLTLAG